MNKLTTGTDLKWAILGTLAIIALLHRATAVDAAPRDPWDEFLADLEAAIALAGG